MALHLTYGVSIILILSSCTSLIMAQSGAQRVSYFQCAALRNNMNVVIKGRPCKIIERSISKIEGQAMINIDGVDYFNGKACKDTCPFTKIMEVPIVSTGDYQVFDIAGDGFLVLLDNEGNIREDIKLVEGSDISTDILNRWENGVDIEVTVDEAIGVKQVVDVKSVSFY